MSVKSRRLSILTLKEIDDLYGLPHFNDEDRCFYFDLSADEMGLMEAIHTRSAAVHLALQLGYFKAKRQFFAYPLEAVQDDLNYILQKYFPGMGLATVKELSKPTRLDNNGSFFNYTIFATLITPPRLNWNKKRSALPCCRRIRFLFCAKR